MRTVRRTWLPLLGLLLFPSLATAQDLSLLVGVPETAVSPTSGRAWQLEFRESLGRYLAVSGSYVNEGHVRDHKRDGLAAQFWGRVPLFRRRVSLDFGGGPYRYFDTQVEAGGGYVDASGWGGSSAHPPRSTRNPHGSPASTGTGCSPPTTPTPTCSWRESVTAFGSSPTGYFHLHEYRWISSVFSQRMMFSETFREQDSPKI